MPRPSPTIDAVIALAQSRGGVLLSKRFLTAKTYYRWECGNRHRWRATYDSVRRGTWCPRCAGKVVSQRDRMTALRKAARRHAGTVLSSICPRVDTKLLFECRKGHRFTADYEHVVGQLTWCPTCRVFIGEEVTRSIFELLTGRRFIRCNPSWLATTRGSKLQLDGYCESLKLAFEYQGVQHFREAPKFFHRKRSFRDQQLRDKRKVALCASHGVTLLRIESPRRLRDLPGAIARLLSDIGVAIKTRPEQIDVVSLGVDTTSSAYARLIAAVEAKRGTLLSKTYGGSGERVLIECPRGHIFSQTPKRIHSGSWCPTCATDRLRLGIEVVRKLAKSVNATCVSKAYANVDDAMSFRCKKCKTEWAATTASLQRGTGCPCCAGKSNGGRTKRTIADLNNVARSRGGKCLSTEYANAHGILTWQCRAGHRWNASAANVLKGTWCPKCSIADRPRAVRAAHARRRRQSS